MKLAEFEAMKAWHQRHWRDHPLEKQVWDFVLTLWLASWVGFPSAWLSHATWVEASCVPLFFLPSLYVALLFLPGAYVRLRQRLHRAGIVRCDWTGALRV